MLIPRSFTLYAYEEMLQDGKLVHSMGITIRVTIIGTLANLIVTLLTAYPLSRRTMPGQKMLMRLLPVTAAVIYVCILMTVWWTKHALLHGKG